MLITMEGKRPPRPAHPAFTEDLWALMQRCWDHDPCLRPGVSEALQVFLTLSVYHSFRSHTFVDFTAFSCAGNIQLGNN